MTPLLQIILEDDGSLTSHSEPLSEDLKAKIYPLLRQIDPNLRRKSPPYEGPNPELAQELILWRRARARELGISAYLILSQKTLYAIADAAPQTEGELLAIPGFGPVLFERHGMDILKITCG